MCSEQVECGIGCSEVGNVNGWKQVVERFGLRVRRWFCKVGVLSVGLGFRA